MTLDGDQGDLVFDAFTPFCPGPSLPQPPISLTGSGPLTRQYLDSEADIDVACSQIPGSTSHQRCFDTGLTYTSLQEQTREVPSGPTTILS